MAAIALMREVVAGFTKNLGRGHPLTQSMSRELQKLNMPKDYVGCPGRHALGAFRTPRPGFCCDVCDASLPEGTDIRGCRICDWDACNKHF